MNYERLYKSTLEELNHLKRKMGSKKEVLVQQVYNLLNINDETCKLDHTYGYFFYKLNIEELIYLIDLFKVKFTDRSQ